MMPQGQDSGHLVSKLWTLIARTPVQKKSQSDYSTFRVAVW
jgi:hypothetical protein